MLRTTVTAIFLVVFATPVLAQDGKQAFSQRCRVCHDQARVAPRLEGVFGRKIASTDYAYSAALKARAGRWDGATLDTYLKQPHRFAPGGKMVVSIPDDATRTAVVAYLKTLN